MSRPSSPNLEPAELAAAIRAVREKQHLSQEQFAQQLGVSTRTVARWEGGESAPRANILSALGLGAGAVAAAVLPGAGLLGAFGVAAFTAAKAGSDLRQTRQRAALGALVASVAATHKLNPKTLPPAMRAILAEMIDSGVTDLRELLGLFDEL